jgi:hypothetical protein
MLRIRLERSLRKGTGVVLFLIAADVVVLGAHQARRMAVTLALPPAAFGACLLSALATFWAGEINN